MKVKKLLENWDLTGLKLKLGFLETEWNPQVKDSEAAWELYVELLTRTATQPMPDEAGVEITALESAYSLFGITRGILRHHGKDCIEFAKIAVVVLNQIIRPFTTRWHRLSIDGAFEDHEKCKQFRDELLSLQRQLSNYMGLLAQIAGVEDISQIESE